ncbi:MCE family protein [Mycobacterium sp. Y57]|uniref:MCE family protein n=1 Tax=Mycolicibacterium xanthum TaxID=2796469 RepID=UPI001C852545|nr:MlaD family protein [Mycolicibacterium xanthum]MBX7430528.1 MCE family protein [Mycolicibacterium xanthum]
MTTRRIKVQLVLFVVVSVVAAGSMLLGYMRVPAMFGIGRYTVTVELPESAGLYPRANVTYRGTEVGRVEDVRLTDTGVQAVLSLRSNVAIPSDLDAEVHSQNAVGEQYVALLPRDGAAPRLRDGDVISLDRTSVPPDINDLLDDTNLGLEAIPADNLETVIDEAYTAVGGLGPEIQRIVKGGTALSIDARENLDSLTALIDQSQPVLDSQTETADAVNAWAAHLATTVRQVADEDSGVRGLLEHGPGAADESRALLERLQPTVPIILANLVSVGDVALAYRNDIEQLLVLLPSATAILQGFILPNRNTIQDYQGAYLAFNMNLNLPPPCTTGFLPFRQMRSPSEVDAPERPEGDLYCRIPQDSDSNVRGVRNIPCETRPGKRAPTVALCESDESYIPLNDGQNWKGDPNATLSGQDIPQLPPGSPPPQRPPTPIAVAPYDPATGTYIGPDGQVYRQSDLGQAGPGVTSWQDLLVPPPQG